jgi:short subunit fatty acids transporter
VIQGIARFFTQIVHRVLPDPLIFAILLTVVTFAMAFGLTPILRDRAAVFGDRVRRGTVPVLS